MAELRKRRPNVSAEDFERVKRKAAGWRGSLEDLAKVVEMSPSTVSYITRTESWEEWERKLQAKRDDQRARVRRKREKTAREPVQMEIFTPEVPAEENHEAALLYLRFALAAGLVNAKHPAWSRIIGAAEDLMADVMARIGLVKGGEGRA